MECGVASNRRERVRSGPTPTWLSLSRQTWHSGSLPRRTGPARRRGPTRSRPPSRVSRHSVARELDYASENLRLMCLLLRRRLIESERRVQQLFHERHAIELDELNILLHPAIEWEAHLPGSREPPRVLDRRFVQKVLRTDGSVAFDHLEGVAVVIPSPVEPGVVVEVRHVDHQRIAFPAAIRPPHPGLTGSVHMRIHVDAAHGTLELIHDENLLRGLENLKWIGHVVRAGHARPKTHDFRVALVETMRIVRDLRCQAFVEVLLLFLQGVRPVREHATLDNAQSSRFCGVRTHDFGMRRRLRRMRLDVPVRRGEGLINPVQVWMAVRCTGGPVSRSKLPTGGGRRSLTRHRSRGEPQTGNRSDRHSRNHHVSRPNAHRLPHSPVSSYTTKRGLAFNM